MNDIWFLFLTLLLAAAQIVCLRARRIWVRLLPVLTACALMLLCAMLYAASGFTNWGFLIIAFLLGGVIGVLGMVWLVYAIRCAIRKRKNNSRV